MVLDSGQGVNGNSIMSLPNDILHILCDELSQQERFDTLFNCALHSAGLGHFAHDGCSIHHKSPVRDVGNEALPIAQQALIVQKWAVLWKSIVSSTFGSTLFPYFRYIKTLDLRDLANLLEDDKFNGKISSKFFSGDLSGFRVLAEPTIGRSRALRLDVVATINAIGEAVTKGTPLLEQLTGDIESGTLRNWASRLPNLRSLELWEGNTIGDEEVQQAILANCPNFEALSIYQWQGSDSDLKLSRFIQGLKPQKLRYLEIISNAGISAQTCLALNFHRHALRELKLSLAIGAIPHLATIKECAALETLFVNGVNGLNILENADQDALVEWLRQCTSLRNLSFTGFQAAAGILTKALSEDQIQLRKLEVDSYWVKDHSDFHIALSKQHSLQSLFLKGDSEGMTRDHIDILTESVTIIKGLRELELRGVSDFFTDDNIKAIAESLTDLEDLYVSGYGVTDAIWESVGRLSNLRSITFNAMTSFTVHGLLDFVAGLGPGNQGLVVAVDMADPDESLTEEEQNIVRDALADKVGGRLEYTLLRDPGMSESDFEGDSD